MSRKGREYAKRSERWQPSGGKSWEGRSPGEGFEKLNSPLKPRSSKRGRKTSGISMGCEPVRNAESQAPAQTCGSKSSFELDP